LARLDFEKLAGLLEKIQGKFILSLNDVPEVRKLFGAFHIQGVELHYTSQKAAGKRYKEVMVMNFEPKPVRHSHPSSSRLSLAS